MKQLATEGSRQFISDFSEVVSAAVRGVIQDSMETALNSSADVIFTATAEFMERKREGKPFSF